MNRKILITGGAGNIGGSLARRLASRPENQVVVVDNLLTGGLDKLPDRSLPNWRFIKADCNSMDDISPIMSSFRFDYVFHYAAVVGVKRTLENPSMVLRDIRGLENVLGLAKSTGVKRVFFSSSSEVYGEPVELPQREDTTPLNSRLPYAIVKNVGEAFCKSYYQEYGLNYTVFRFFNTYGPLQSEDFVLARFLGQALKNEPITIYGDGSQTRTYCYVEDNMDTTEKVLNEDLAVNEVLNVGSDQEISVLDLAKEIIRITESGSELKFLPPLKEGDMTRRLPDATRMRAYLGRELISLESGIRKMLDAL